MGQTSDVGHRRQATPQPARDTTARLCAALCESAAAPLAAPVRRAAERSLLNVLGTAIGASREPAVETVLAKAAAHGGRPVAPIPGRPERADLTHAALATGIAAHLDDFDDTHLATVIHPGAATLGASLGLAHQRHARGRELLTAFALGCEAQLRVGVAMSPSHYDAGWHITGTCGVVGAAVAAGLLLELGPEQLATAIGIAASSTLGIREAFGTMTKSFHPGKAASNGIQAAVLTARGFSAPTNILDHPRGLYHVLAEDYDPEAAVAGFGSHWELLANTFKPYPCGIVTHPAIDAAVALAGRPDYPGAEAIEDVVIRCHPLVVELTGNPDPEDGLQARFATIHGVAAGLLRGTVGLPEYDDAFVRDAATVGLRSRCRFEVDAALARAAAEVELHLAGGQRLREFVEHARGSLERPLSDAELEAKVRGLVDPILPGRTGALVAAVDALADADTVNELVDAATPEGAVL